MAEERLSFVIDASSAEAGANQFAAAINQVTKAVVGLDAKATATFSQLSKTTFKDFKAPSATQVKNLKGFTSAIARMKMPKGNFNAIVRLSEAFVGFKAPSRTQTANLTNFVIAISKLRVPKNATALAAALDKIAISGARASRVLKGIRGNVSALGFRGFQKRVKGASGAMRGLENAFDGTFQAASLFRTFFGVFTLATFTKSVIDATLSVMRFESLMRAVNQNAREFVSPKAEFEFLRKSARGLGADLGVVVDQYGKFAAAARISGLSSKETRAVYESLAGATRVLGLEAERVKLSFLAVTQILSKGRVSTEELRRQLGEQIPGLFELFAKEVEKQADRAGVAFTSLDDMLRKGMITGQGGALILEKILREQFGAEIAEAVKRIDGRIAGLKTTIFELKKTIGEAGFLKNLAAGVFELDNIMRSQKFQDAAVAIGEKMTSAFNAAVKAAKFLLDHLEEVTKVLKILGTVILIGTFQRIALGILGIFAPAVKLFKFLKRTSTGFTEAAVAGKKLSKTMLVLTRTATIFTGIGLVAALVTLSLVLLGSKEDMEKLGTAAMRTGDLIAASFELVSEKIKAAVGNLRAFRDAFEEKFGIARKAEETQENLERAGFTKELAKKNRAELAAFFKEGVNETIRDGQRLSSLLRKTGELLIRETGNFFSTLTQIQMSRVSQDFDMLGMAARRGADNVIQIYKEVNADLLAENKRTAGTSFTGGIAGAGAAVGGRAAGRASARSEANRVRGIFNSIRKAVKEQQQGGIQGLTGEIASERIFSTIGKLSEREKRKIDKLMDSLDPLAGATRKYKEDLERLNTALDKTVRTSEKVEKIQKAYNEAVTRAAGKTEILAAAERARKESLAQLKNTEEDRVRLIKKLNELNVALIPGAQAFNKVLKEQREILAKEELLENVEAMAQIEQAFKDTGRSAEEFAEAIRQTQLAAAGERVKAGVGTFTDGFRVAFDETLKAGQEWQQEMGSLLTEPFDKMTVAIGDAAAQSIVFGDNFIDAIGSAAKQAMADLISQMVQLTIRMLIFRAIAGVGGGGGAGRGGSGISFNSASGFFESPVGLHTGGQFTVGGSPGRDTNFVPLNLTKGEQVTVRTPGQQSRDDRAGGTGNVVNVTQNISTPNPRAFKRDQSNILAAAFSKAQENSRRFN